MLLFSIYDEKVTQ